MISNASYSCVVETWRNDIDSFIKAPRNDFEYGELTKFLDFLVDDIGDNPSNKGYSLLEYIASLIEKYDEGNTFFKEPAGIETLQHLMDEHNLKQSEMKEIGSQGVTSEVLNGKRPLTTRMIKDLAKRFNVSPIVFI